MAKKNIDNILMDGRVIFSLIDNSLSGIIFFQFDKQKPNMHTSEFNEKTRIDELSSYWKELKTYAEKYPGSNYIKDQQNMILKRAKEDLPEEIYSRIYKL